MTSLLDYIKNMSVDSKSLKGKTMAKDLIIKPPFFEIGPKAFMYGDDVVKLAIFCDQMVKKYDVRIILTPQYTDIYRCAQATTDVLVFAQHMDPIKIGRGLGSVLPEAVKAAGAKGVMLNHAERPISLAELNKSIKRADELGLATIVCAESPEEAQAIAHLGPNIIIAEQTQLIGTGESPDYSYISESIKLVKSINPNIGVLPGAGIKNGKDVYDVIMAGAEGTGSTSGIMKAQDPLAMVEEMISAVRLAWDTRHK